MCRNLSGNTAEIRSQNFIAIHDNDAIHEKKIRERSTLVRMFLCSQTKQGIFTKWTPPLTTKY